MGIGRNYLCNIWEFITLWVKPWAVEVEFRRSAGYRPTSEWSDSSLSGSSQGIRNNWVPPAGLIFWLDWAMVSCWIFAPLNALVSGPPVAAPLPVPVQVGRKATIPARNFPVRETRPAPVSGSIPVAGVGKCPRTGGNRRYRLDWNSPHCPLDRSRIYRIVPLTLWHRDCEGKEN